MRLGSSKGDTFAEESPNENITVERGSTNRLRPSRR
jgi:hypothetical protein